MNVRGAPGEITTKHRHHQTGPHPVKLCRVDARRLMSRGLGIEAEQTRMRGKRARKHGPGAWSRLGESNPDLPIMECLGHRRTCAHPSYLRTPAPPPRHSVHTWRYKCRSFSPRTSPRNGDEVASYVARGSSSSCCCRRRRRRLGTRLQEALVACLGCLGPEVLTPPMSFGPRGGRRACGDFIPVG